MQVLPIIFVVVSCLLILQLVYPFLTVLLAQLFGKERLGKNGLKNQPPSLSTDHQFDFACIITAYRNAPIAKPLVESLLKQTYSNHIIYLVADECPDFNFDISDERFVLLRPASPLRLKVKSIIHAAGYFKRPHDFIVIFDADNLAHPDFLEEINRYANAGYGCIQGQRTAKNLDTAYAALDSLGEHYKNYIEREAPYLLGGSAVISGSGMATEAGLYNAWLKSPEIESGKHQGKKMLQEDKILQNYLVRRDVKIAYARRALVFDEKTASGDAVEIQRSRWLFSYFQNIPNAAGLLFLGLKRLNFNQFCFGWATLALPMFIQVGLAALLAFAGLFIAPFWTFALAAATGIFTLNILWVLKLDGAPKPVWDAFWNVPQFVWRQCMSLLRMRNPYQQFKPTEHHRELSVEDVLKHDGKNRLH